MRFSILVTLVVSLIVANCGGFISGKIYAQDAHDYDGTEARRLRGEFKLQGLLETPALSQLTRSAVSSGEVLNGQKVLEKITQLKSPKTSVANGADDVASGEKGKTATHDDQVAAIPVVPIVKNLAPETVEAALDKGKAKIFRLIDGLDDDQKQMLLKYYNRTPEDLKKMVDLKEVKKILQKLNKDGVGNAWTQLLIFSPAVFILIILFPLMIMMSWHKK